MSLSNMHSSGKRCKGLLKSNLVRPSCKSKFPKTKLLSMGLARGKKLDRDFQIMFYSLKKGLKICPETILKNTPLSYVVRCLNGLDLSICDVQVKVHDYSTGNYTFLDGLCCNETTNTYYILEIKSYNGKKKTMLSTFNKIDKTCQVLDNGLFTNTQMNQYRCQCLYGAYFFQKQQKTTKNIKCLLVISCTDDFYYEIFDSLNHNIMKKSILDAQKKLQKRNVCR